MHEVKLIEAFGIQANAIINELDELFHPQILVLVTRSLRLCIGLVSDQLLNGYTIVLRKNNYVWKTTPPPQ